MLKLRAVSRSQGNNQALKAGDVRPRQCDLEFEEVPVLIDAFRRMVRELAYDVCEMAITTYLCAKAYGKPFTALPVFLVRGFHHNAVSHDPRSGIGPGDLAGRKVGVNRGYTVTTGVWARAILKEEYGLDPGSVTWMRSGDEHVAEYEPPANVLSLPGGRSLAERVRSGDLAAAIGAEPGAGLAPMLPDADEAGYAALTGRGLYPINHLVVVRDELLRAHPGLATDLFRAFSESKQRYVQRLGDGLAAGPTATDRMYRRVMELTGRDPLPYGIEPNRHMVNLLIEHATEQRILSRKPAIESLFAPGTHDLTG